MIHNLVRCQPIGSCSYNNSVSANSVLFQAKQMDNLFNCCMVISVAALDDMKPLLKHRNTAADNPWENRMAVDTAMFCESAYISAKPVFDSGNLVR